MNNKTNLARKEESDGLVLFKQRTVYCLEIPEFKLRKALEVLVSKYKSPDGKIVKYECSHTLPALHDITETEEYIDLNLGKQIKGEGQYEEEAFSNFRNNLVDFYKNLCKVSVVGALNYEESIQRVYLATILKNKGEK